LDDSSQSKIILPRNLCKKRFKRRIKFAKVIFWSSVMKISRVMKVFTLTFLLFLSGCMSAAQHHQSLHSSHDREFTLGLVQARIYHGMYQSDVAEALGSPNIVTRDDRGDETWVYDKIASEASYSHDRGSGSGAAAAAGVPGTTLLLGGLGGSYSRAAGATATSNRTLTVVVKYDKDRRVKDFSYHSSRF